MGIARYFIALCAISQPAIADVSGAYNCYGVAPGWSLSVMERTAIFTNPDPLAMDVMQDDFAQGSSETRAMTLLGGQQSAVVVIKNGFCRIGHEAFSVGVTVLTQHEDTAHILEGCCAPKN